MPLCTTTRDYPTIGLQSDNAVFLGGVPILQLYEVLGLKVLGIVKHNDTTIINQVPVLNDNKVASCNRITKLSSCKL